MSSRTAHSVLTLRHAVILPVSTRQVYCSSQFSPSGAGVFFASRSMRLTRRSLACLGSVLAAVLLTSSGFTCFCALTDAPARQLSGCAAVSLPIYSIWVDGMAIPSVTAQKQKEPTAPSLAVCRLWAPRPLALVVTSRFGCSNWTPLPAFSDAGTPLPVMPASRRFRKIPGC